MDPKSLHKPSCSCTTRDANAAGCVSKLTRVHDSAAYKFAWLAKWN